MHKTPLKRFEGHSCNLHFIRITEPTQATKGECSSLAHTFTPELSQNSSMLKMLRETNGTSAPKQQALSKRPLRWSHSAFRHSAGDRPETTSNQGGHVVTIHLFQYFRRSGPQISLSQPHVHPNRRHFTKTLNLNTKCRHFLNKKTRPKHVPQTDAARGQNFSRGGEVEGG